MSELAYDVNGDAIELPAAAQWWRVRRFRNPGARGAPEVVIDKDGAPAASSDAVTRIEPSGTIRWTAAGTGTPNPRWPPLAPLTPRPSVTPTAPMPSRLPA